MPNMARFIRDYPDDVEAAAILGCKDVVDEIQHELVAGTFGDPQLAYWVSVRLADGSGVDVRRGVCRDEDVPFNAELFSNYVGDAHALTTASGAPVRLVPGYTRKPKGFRSVVTPLDESGAILLVITCAGLSELSSGVMAELLGAKIKLRILRMYKHQYGVAA